MQKILAIIGSAQSGSSNLKLVQFLADALKDRVSLEYFEQLRTLPHFDPAASLQEPPRSIQAIRDKIEAANGILISSPEYIFSIPAGLKNLLEWMVATTLFTDKPLALILASADGRKAFAEIREILQTLGGRLPENCCLLIPGIRGRIDGSGLPDADLQSRLLVLSKAFLQELTV